MLSSFFKASLDSQDDLADVLIRLHVPVGLPDRFERKRPVDRKTDAASF
jgi:hypothetical protein